MKAFVSRKEYILARYEFGARYKRFRCAIQMVSERETNSEREAHVYATGGSPCAIMAASSDPEALVADKLSKIYQTLGVQPVSSVTCYDVTNSPEPVRPVSRVRVFRSNSRWYGCCDWLLVPRGVSLDSHHTWTDSWCADLLPRNKCIHSRNKRIHSRNKCIHSRKTVSVSRI